MSSKPLGRGLDALLGQPRAAAAPAAGDVVQKIGVDRIAASPFQPRRTFDDDDLADLAASIRAQGILQPLVARPKGADFELIAGERRLRAARLAGLLAVPVIVRAASDQEALALALIENLQRSGLNPIEEAEGYSQLQKMFGLTQEQIAQRVGKPRATVANSLRLLALEATVLGFVSRGQLSEGHAKVILGLDEPALQRAAAERILRQGLSVREAEGLVESLKKGAGGGGHKHGAKRGGGRAADGDAHVKDVEARLRRHLGTKVAVHHAGGKGRIEIEYYSLDDLDRLLELIGPRG